MILVVDDDPALRRFIRMVLEEAGHVVDEASNGQKALAQMKGAEYNLVVADLSMPEMDGFELLKTIRSVWPALRVLVVSGLMGSTAMLNAATYLGAAAVLGKPFSADDLLTAVKRARV